ncbi:hypothetical protein EVAR_66935_1 [Eumeta japonica]|uniref:Dystonin n=1 Tax=Eumeta variegata TaxID=151549 RepID=A0A4C2A687_EUMVA|nr:hypothetical protein EVAR_66935_1 [Eumeta japonica]
MLTYTDPDYQQQSFNHNDNEIVSPECIAQGCNHHGYHRSRLCSYKDLDKLKLVRLPEAFRKVVRNPSNGDIVPLTSAMQIGLIDPTEGRFIADPRDSKNSMDFVKATEKGLLLPAEQRQIKHEIESQQRPVATCLEQIRQIVLTGGDVLSAPEVATLENAGRELRSRVDRVNDRTVRMLRRLEAGLDELNKLRSELDIFSDWLQSARQALEDKERALSDLTRLSSQAETVREFVSDVIGHQADLRFITMAAQKFVDESKEFLAILNDFRTSLPERLHHVEPLSSAESPIRQEVSLVSAQYKDLMNRVNALQDRISGLGGRQREYQDALEKASDWLRTTQPRVSRVISEPIAGEPKSVQEQMNAAKSLHSELLSNGRLVDNAQHALDSLLYTLGGQLSPMEIKQLKFQSLSSKISINHF